MDTSKWILKTTEYLRPLLVKLVPQKILSQTKKKLLLRRTSQLKDLSFVPFDREKYAKGVNLIGNVKGDSGLGQSCRLLANVLKHSPYPLCIVQHSASSASSTLDSTYDACLEHQGQYGINIFHMNPQELVTAYLQLGREVWDGHYNIAYWLWELEEFPDEWVNCIDLLDEIWTPAEFISAGIRKKTHKPVTTIPYYVTAPTCEEYDRSYFKLPEDKFLFLMMFDCGSMMERKNPKAVINAFKTAFSSAQNDVGLVIKVIGAAPEDIENIEQYADGCSNIYLINQMFSKLEINSLIRCSDVVVSLHRAEGFGLVLAEAMLNGVPCIATNWSANTEFMNLEAACMVDYELVELKEDIGPFKKGSRWAEPDVKQAAEYMRRLYYEPDYRGTIAENAKKHIQEFLSMDRAVSLVNDRVNAIYGG